MEMSTASVQDTCDVCGKSIKAHWRPDRDDSVYYTFCGHLVCRQCIKDYDTRYVVGCASDGCRMCCLLSLAKGIARRHNSKRETTIAADDK